MISENMEELFHVEEQLLMSMEKIEEFEEKNKLDIMKNNIKKISIKF